MRLSSIRIGVTSLMVSSLLFSVAAGATDWQQSDDEVYYTWADVTEVVPIVSRHRVVTPREECRSTPVSYRKVRKSRPRNNNEVLPGLLGGLIGGAIGNQFGGGNGKKALTVMGALAGASIASGAQRQQSWSDDFDTYERSVRKCRVINEVEEIEEIEGYEVTYRYMDREFVKTVDEYPSERIRIQVQISAVESDNYAWL